MHKHEKSALLGKTIRANAATPAGFDVTDCPKGGTMKAAHQRCRLMIQRGELFKARANYRLIRYFDTQAAATAFVRANFTSEAVKRTAPAVALKPSKLTYSEIHFLRSAKGKPKAQPAPRPDAEIVHTAQTRYSSTMMTDRYAVSVPYQRIGQPGWAMSVGGAA